MKWLQEEKRCIQQPWVSWALWLCCPCPQWPARCQALSAKCCSMLELLSPPAVPAVNPPIWYRSCDFSELSSIPGITIPGKEEKKGKIKDTGCGGWGGARPGFTIYCSFQSVITAGSSTTMDAPMLPMPAPLCLVTNKDSVLSLDRTALAVLRSVTQPLVVVAIAGLYRTGKSYLMNQLAQKRTGFPLGPTVHAETKGIWMWCLPHPRRQGVTLVLLDTEGLGDPKKDDDDSDAWIFTLAVLLSSTLVYNSIGTIDQRALEQLRLVTELTEHIRVREENDNPTSNFVRVFPCFVWTVRDFTLQLRAGEKALSEDEYLDDILRKQTGYGKKAKERNELRSCLRNFFPRRKLFTMERPAADADLQRLEELREDELQPGFRKQADAFCRYIWEEAPVKVLPGGHQVTGSVLAGLAEKYVAAITSGAVPCVESAVTALARAENSAAVEAAVAEYQRGMEHSLVLPTASRSALVAVHRDCEQRAIALFLSRAFADHERQYHAELVCKLEAAKDEFCWHNEEASEQRCHAVLQELWRDVELRLQNGDYVAPGGAQLFKEDLNRVLEEYKRRPDKGVRAEAVLEVFLREREGLAQVLKATEVQLELVERQREAAAAEAEAAEARLEEQRRTMEEHKRQLEQQLKEEQRAWLEEQQRVLEHHKKEYEALVQEGFKREAAAMQELMTQLEKEKKNRKRDTWISSALNILAPFLPGVAGKLFNKLRPM